MSTFFDYCFGSWFEPRTAFARLAEDLPLWQAVGIVALVNLVEGFRVGGAVGAFFQVPSGLIGWLVLNGLLWLFAILVNQKIAYARLLTLTGFASLPWLLVAPAALLGGPIGGIGLLLALLWFVGLQTWAVSVAMAWPWWRVALLIPLTFVAALVALNWTVNTLMTTTGLSR